MEYSRSLLKFMHTWRWSKCNYQVIGETEPQPVISNNQMKFPVLGIRLQLIELLVKGVPLGISKQPRLLPRQQVALHKLTVSPHYWRWHLHNSLNMEKSCQCLHRAFTPCASIIGTGRYSACYQKRNIDIKSHINPLVYNGALPVRCSRAMVAQSLCR